MNEFKVPTFAEHLNERNIPFNPDYGRKTKISKEILEIVKEAFPKNVIEHIESVGAYSGVYTTPPTISNRGQSAGNIEYKALIINFHEFGQGKIAELQVGMRKGTAGPGTGYLAIQGRDRKGHYLLDDKFKDDYSVAIEFFDDPAKELKKLFDREIKKYV